MRIRLATESDISDLHRVRISVRENRLSDPTRIQPDDYRSMLATRGRGWVCEHEGRIVGFAVADLAGANVWALFVDPAHEGRGCGRRLHDTMMEWMFTEGAATVWLSTAPGTRAERFYRAAGWRYVGPERSGEARYEMRRDTWRMSMSENQATVERYLEGFRQDDHRMILSCLTDDVEWIVPGAFHLHGRDQFAGEIVSEGFVPPPTIEVTRMLEVSDVVFAEGFVGTRREDGTRSRLAMCDVFEMRAGKIHRLTSYLMPMS